MPKFKPNTNFQMESPLKTKLGRWLMGRKKQTLNDGGANQNHDPHGAYRTAEQLRENRKNRGY